MHSLGLCEERLDNIEAALKNYEMVAKLYSIACGGSRRANGIEEVDRIVEEVLFRLCYYSKSSITKIKSFSPHNTYLTLIPSPSSSTPVLFRPTKALLIHQSMRKIIHESKLVGNADWWEQIKRNNAGEELVLRAFTELPKAGKINGSYLRFLDGVMLGWKIGGAGVMGAEENVKVSYVHSRAVKESRGN